MKLFTLTRLLFLLLLPLAACAADNSALPTLVEGKDYDLIAQPGPFAPLDGKVEVVEVFGYTCPHCAHFQPLLEAWQARQKADVRFTAVPAVFGGYWDSYARAYYAAEQVGAVARTHDEMFKALHERHSLPFQNVSAQELATFYADYGVEPQRFIDALGSDQVMEKMRDARAFAIRTGVDGTPTLIVNGKYIVKGNSFEGMLSNADALIARERAAATSH